MVKLINYSLIAALPLATSADPHIRNSLFTRSRRQDGRGRCVSCVICVASVACVALNGSHASASSGGDLWKLWGQVRAHACWKPRVLDNCLSSVCRSGAARASRESAARFQRELDLPSYSSPLLRGETVWQISGRLREWTLYA